jgi:hypothetical protein
MTFATFYRFPDLPVELRHHLVPGLPGSSRGGGVMARTIICPVWAFEVILPFRKCITSMWFDIGE